MSDRIKLPAKEPKINPDVFAYPLPANSLPGSTPLTQCISGFGRNAIEAIGADLREEPADDPEMRERLAWHIGELVRWCQHFNQKSQRLVIDHGVALRQRDAFERGLRAQRDALTAATARLHRLEKAAKLAIPELRCLYSQVTGHSIETATGGSVYAAVQALTAALAEEK